MFNHGYLPGDRATTQRDPSIEDSPEEKIKVVSYGEGDELRIKFISDDFETTVPAWRLLVDQDHQTCLNVDEQGGDHLISVDCKPSVGIDPSVAAYGDGLRQIHKIRLDVLALILQATSLYPNTGAAIQALTNNVPKR